MSHSKPKRKVDDEHRQFQERWTLQYFFVEFNGNATCLICKEKVAVLKEYNLKRHYSTKHGEQYEKYQADEREKTAMKLKRELTSQQSLFHKAKKDADAAVEASYVVSELIAKAGKPFTEGPFMKDCMLKVAEILCPEKKGLFNNLSLSANTVAERISELSSDIYDQLRGKARVFTAYSVALDESTDKTDIAQLAIFIRGINEQFEVTEELLSLCPMHGRTTANAIFQQLCDAIERAGLPWNRLVGITTDGAPSMTGKKNGLVALVQRKLEEENANPAVVLHCIIHQQALCSKCLKYEHVMSVVLKCVNYIRSRGLQHRQFQAFLAEIESTYGDVLYFTEVRWLSRGNVLKRFFDLRAEVKRFMEDGRMDVPEFDDPKWVMDLAFLVDITQELNILNLKLQGPGQLITAAAYESVKAFSTKLRLWKTQISAKNLSHFTTCRSLVEQGTGFSGDEYASAIDNLLEEFDQRFADFKSHRDTFQLFADPFSTDVESVPSVLQMELIDLQCNSELKTKFREAQGKADKTGQFLRELPPCYPELSKVFSRVMCLFGSTYLCEKLFSTMNFNKCKYRSRLSDAHLEAVLRVSTVTSIRANVAQLCEQKRCQVSGKK
ncbi:general transcription factor II-I repeat domain-containing protein 2-like [Rhinichthys klamathensis goyatoka]|uniref:general transcription factor II-I repeat domain-containing protein 2-like n=1 Tax=Rhinichthys klamathensis goyatoka TaxID=3034132 RepID=UPI0024B50CC3|nr:general transcription factor II-I repeat domain-containing protein 2-like [Rhinichthys klamathensis goyatoka]